MPFSDLEQLVLEARFKVMASTIGRWEFSFCSLQDTHISLRVIRGQGRHASHLLFQSPEGVQLFRGQVAFLT